MTTLTPADLAGRGAATEAKERQLAKRQAFRRALAADAGREMLVHLAAMAGLNQAAPPDTSLSELAFREGRRALVLEMIAHAGIDIEFGFPPLEPQAARPKDIETD